MRNHWMKCAAGARLQALLLALALPALAATAADEQDPESRFDALSEVVAKEMKELGIPGAPVGIVHEGRRFTKGFGVTNVDHPLGVTDQTLFQIGSITKTFTGTLLLRLIEEKALGLDDRVRDLVPDFSVSDENATENATVRDLLTHVGGWEGDVFEDQGSGDDAVALYVAALKDVEQLAPLGSVWSYNNSGFVVAGRVVEAVTGETYEQALETKVLEPLGLSGCFIDPADVMTRRFASGHGVGEHGATVLRPWPIGRYAHAAGGLACSVRSLLRYARFHLGMVSAPTVLSSEAVERMRRVILQKHGSDGRMALTWHLADIDGVETVGHGGGTVGQISSLTMVPERGFALVVLTNAGRGGRLARTVRREAMRAYLGLTDSDPEASEASEAQLARYAGRYSRPFADLDLVFEDGALNARLTVKRGFPNRDSPPPPPSPFFALGLHVEDRLVVEEGPRKGALIEVVRLADGNIGWIRFGGRIYRRVVE